MPTKVTKAAKTTKTSKMPAKVTKTPKVVKVPRRDILHTCSACPTSDANRFDRLKNGGGHNKTRSLEYHVEKTHPNHKGDFEDLKGTPVYKHRLISRPVPKTTTAPKTTTKAAKNKKSSKGTSG